MKKRIYILALLFIFFSILMIPTKVQALTTTTATTGTSNAISNIFSLVDESGGNLSTNSHFEFLNFWCDSEGMFNILWHGDKQAGGKKTVSLTIAGTSIDEIFEYTNSFTIIDVDGTENTFSATSGDKYYVAKFNNIADFSKPFNIDLNSGAGGFNVVAAANVKFYILVEDNVNGVTSVDWLQSRGNVTVGNIYRVNSNSYDGMNYQYYDLTLPDATTSTRNTSNYADVTGAEGITRVMFYYTSEEVNYNVNVEKIWDDNNSSSKRPEMIRIMVTENGNESNIYYDLNTATESSHTFTNLPRYDTNGVEIEYGVIEKEINEGDLSQYSSTVTGNLNDGFQITNILIENYIKNLNISKKVMN